MIKQIEPNLIYPPSKSALSVKWWRFTEPDRWPATGAFRADGARRPDRLYFPLANDGGALSWTSPLLHGGPAAGHHHYLAPPLTAEDLPHTLLHRGFWLVEEGRRPFSLSPIADSGAGPGIIEAGPGWFRLTRRGPARRFTLSATLWCPADLPDPVELMRVELINTGRRTLRVIPYAAVPIFARSADNVRDHRHVTALLNRVEIVPRGVVVTPTMSFDERGHRPNTTRYAVLAVGPRGAAPAGIWASQDQFLGAGGTFAKPEAVWRALTAPDARQERRPGREALAGFRFGRCALKPGARAEFLIVAGIGRRAGDAARWSRWAARPGAATASLRRTQDAWAQTARGVAFKTPDRTLNNWLAWVGVQPHLRRLYGNSYLPQFDYGRGGRGWRDLWQDCLALLLTDPARTRSLLLHNIGGVRIDGSNATIIARNGGFIADRNNIPRTWMDHGVWPVFTTLLYVDQTGDSRLLLEPREYFRDPQIFRCRRRDPDWTPAQGAWLRARSGRVYRGSVLEHLLVQTLTACFNVGGHGVCRLEGADWNDGLDMAAGRGESVAFSAFYAWNLERLARTVEQLSRRGVREVELAEELTPLFGAGGTSAASKRLRLDRYLARVAGGVSGRTVRVPANRLAGALRSESRALARRIGRREWLRTGRGGWFNGYYDDAGRRVEGMRGGRVRMTLTGQVFPIMSGIATPSQIDGVVRSVDRFLREPRHGGIRLNTDFGGPQPRLGRAFSFAFGEKENGAVFSHMAVMYAYALYLRRRPHAGRRVWRALYRLATDQEPAGIFPGLPEYFNLDQRGLYAYLTGSASWLMVLLVTQVFGARGEWGNLVLDPQLSREDFDGQTESAVQLMFAGRPLRVTLVNRRRLDAGRYRVSSIRAGSAPVPFTPRPDGGASISRRVIERLSRRVPTVLRVELSPRT